MLAMGNDIIFKTFIDEISAEMATYLSEQGWTMCDEWVEDKDMPDPTLSEALSLSLRDRIDILKLKNGRIAEIDAEIAKLEKEKKSLLKK